MENMNVFARKLKYIYNSGDKYGMLTLTGNAVMGKYGRLQVECICSCGNTSWPRFSKLIHGATKSCGCMVGSATIHGLNKHPLRSIWKGMNQRCLNPNSKFYSYYGGRGITVDLEWSKSVKSFYEWAINNGWEQGLTLDRKNVNDGYYPSNCQWATWKEQGRNRRSNVFITAFGETKCVAEWERDERSLVSDDTISLRIKKGWLPEDAISTPKLKPKRNDRS